MAATDYEPRTVRRWLALGLATGIAVALVVLLSHSVSGAAAAQLSTWQIALWSAASCAVAMAAWRLDDEDRCSDDAPVRLGRATAAALAGMLLGLLLAGSNGTGVAVVAVITIVWTVVAVTRVLQLKEPLVAALTSRDSAAVATPKVERQARPSIASADPDAEVPEGHADSLSMQLQRRKTSEGEAIEVQARLEFAPGAREVALHVPFWPALSSDPEVECEPLDGDDVDLQVASAERYGIRLEARLPSASEEARTVLIGIEICAGSSESRLPAAA